MLAYPLSEAEVLLQEKLTAAKESLENCEEDLDFLRQQITVSSPLGLDEGGAASAHISTLDGG